MPKTYNDLYLEARRRLKSADIAEYSLEARVILASAAGKTKEEFVRDAQLYVSEEYEKKTGAMIDRRLGGEPVAYITGEWEFYGLPLFVTRDVLIPRPDSECLVDEAKELMQGRQEARLLDLCTGSGCIGLAAARAIPAARVVLSDISQDALKVCRLNILRNHMTQRAMVLRADITETPPMLMGSFDLVFCNPPYIPASEIAELDGSVKDYEPHGALNGGEDGLDFYRALAANWRRTVKQGGFLAVEHGLGQSEDVKKIITAGEFMFYKTVRDFRGVDRAAVFKAV